MKILIHDASVLIDLLKLELLDSALSLPYIMQTTDFVRDEIKEPDQHTALVSCIEQKRITVLQSNSDQIMQMYSIKTQAPRLSIQDCSIIYHAKNGGQVVIAADNLLRKQARNHGLEVHGTLWLFDQLVKNSIVNTSIASEKLSRLINQNQRLPQGECERLIKTWNEIG